MSFSEIRDDAVYTAASKLTRGCYQQSILDGSEALSGSTLRGRARDYGDRYKRSAQALLARCQEAGLAVREEIQSHGKRVVVIG